MGVVVNRLLEWAYDNPRTSKSILVFLSAAAIFKAGEAFGEALWYMLH
ncbi:hypothetical protein [Prevotella sp. HUN102]|nr:hypothetical protein [Prevotella sp. HUN102]